MSTIIIVVCALLVATSLVLIWLFNLEHRLDRHAHMIQRMMEIIDLDKVEDDRRGVDVMS